MIELGELERYHGEFAARHLRVIAISNDDVETAALNQADFPHLVLLSDATQSAARALGMIHPHAAADGTDTNAPTTVFVSGDGTVAQIVRPAHFMTRLSPQAVVAIADRLWTRR